MSSGALSKVNNSFFSLLHLDKADSGRKATILHVGSQLDQ